MFSIAESSSIGVHSVSGDFTAYAMGPRRVVPRRRLDRGELQDLDYAERVLNEAMRLYPPVYTLFRSVQEATHLGGYRAPEGALVMLPQ